MAVNVDKLFDNLSGYIDAKIKLMKLDVKEDVSRVMSKMVVNVMLLLLFFHMVLFLFLGAALLIGDYIQSYGFGFLIVAGFFLLFLIFIYVFKDKLGIKYMVGKAMEDLMNSEDE